ncbi:MAG: stage 0 sporulation family protein, partial [Oscillospiraceae bacterium]|nr:stage 0 sporulation family protein [Oscillospiraceae bacterium]
MSDVIDVVSIKFKNRGKCYFFDPAGVEMHPGDRVIVETSKGLEIADCVRGVHSVPETSVVLPLRPVVRKAGADDIRMAEANSAREKEAYGVCQKKINERGLDMKLVDVECSFDGSKTTFFFTSEDRVDFRELVKDLAAVFHNRIELRQIGVRDEAKMIGGLGICGRPFCCHQFLDDFQPVSTKMAKVQSLSLNPTKISGCCGRLMCCLRYEEEAYEDLVKKVPKQGAFVETKDGFGTAVQVNLLRQTVKVRLDSDSDDSLHVYKPNELCAVPGGRPKDGSAPVSTFVYVPQEEEPEEEIEAAAKVWERPSVLGTSFTEESSESREETQAPVNETPEKRERSHSRNRRKKKAEPGSSQAEQPSEKAAAMPEKQASENPEEAKNEKERSGRHSSGRHRNYHRGKGAPAEKQAKGQEKLPSQEGNHKSAQGAGAPNKPKKQQNVPSDKNANAQSSGEGQAAKPKNNNHRRYYHNRKPKNGGGNGG